MTETLTRIMTERCRIERLTVEDAPALAAITDTSVTSQIPFLPEPFGEGDARALIADPDFHAVRDAAGGELLGVIGVHRRDGGVHEVGYWFAAAARGRGIATEAVRGVVRALAEARPGGAIVAECRPGNARSRALLRRAGFVETGAAGQRPGRMLLSWRAEVNDRIDVC
ncbi:MAG: N-acetyltransferase [Alphaproteobacteria bacterium HGW-Alphaproteobacteria-13]|jgi:RimJ/RimL family protein N-acetyltransferase|nr:MAG: N-acetyltransferase [Alphaproteobacteria bacterium HGW-Alphaproteobacteria-13]